MVNIMVNIMVDIMVNIMVDIMVNITVNKGYLIMGNNGKWYYQIIRKKHSTMNNAHDYDQRNITHPSDTFGTCTLWHLFQNA